MFFVLVFTKGVFALLELLGNLTKSFSGVAVGALLSAAVSPYTIGPLRNQPRQPHIVTVSAASSTDQHKKVPRSNS